jgi:hypothetical protein
VLMNQHRLLSISRHDQYTPGCARSGASRQRIAASARALPAVIATEIMAADMALIGVIPSSSLAGGLKGKLNSAN